MITNITNISLQNELYKNIKNDIDNGIITGAAALVHKAQSQHLFVLER